MSYNQRNVHDDTFSADLLPLDQQLQEDGANWEVEQVPASNRLVEFLRSVPGQSSQMVLNTQSLTDTAAEDSDAPVILSPTRQHRFSVRRSPLPAIAALLLISLGAAIFGLMAHSHQPISTNYPHGSCSPNQISVHGLQDVGLWQIAMVSPDEGWAVGSPEGNLDGPPMFHYNHCQWQPVSLNPVGVEFTNITMLSAQDGWALGSLATAASRSHSATQGLIFHYNGSQWQRVPSPVLLRQGQYIADFRMPSSHEGWLIIASQEKGGAPIVGSQMLYHEVNSVWKQVSMPSEVFPESVIPIAANEAWLICSGLVKDDVQLYHNGDITPSYDTSGYRWDSPIYVNTSRDGWFTIGAVANYRWFDRTLLHFNGTSWHDDTALISEPRIQTAVHVQIFSGQDGWAFPAGKDSYTDPTNDSLSYPLIDGALWLHNGHWQSVPWPHQQFIGIISMVQVSPVEYWAIGEYPNNGTEGKYCALLHFVNGGWTAYS